MRCLPHSIGPEKPDRSCGFLTKTEREFLLGTWDPNGDGSGFDEGQAERKRNDIKVRTRHALADLALLQQYADEDLKSGVVEKNADPPIFDEQAMNHMYDGLFRFAADVSMGEDASNALAEQLENGQLMELVNQLMAAAAGGDLNKMLVVTCNMFATASEGGLPELSEEEFTQTIAQYPQR